MKVVAISDQHGHLPKIPKCDLLIIAGDVCPHMGVVDQEWNGEKVKRRVPVGSSDDIFFQSEWLNGPFRKWIDKTKAKNKILIFGNHDFIAEKSPHMIPIMPIHILQDNSVVIDGLKIWGSPRSLPFYDWAFNNTEEELERIYSNIPADTDVIVSHGPAFGTMDWVRSGERVGSKALLRAIEKIKPQLVIVGHIHDAYGVDKITVPGVTICNASVLDDNYNLCRSPLTFDVFNR